MADLRQDGSDMLLIPGEIRPVLLLVDIGGHIVISAFFAVIECFFVKLRGKRGLGKNKSAENAENRAVILRSPEFVDYPGKVYVLAFIV